MVQCSSLTLKKVFSNPAANTTVFKCGAATGQSAGTVKSTNLSFTTSQNIVFV